MSKVIIETSDENTKVSIERITSGINSRSRVQLSISCPYFDGYDGEMRQYHAYLDENGVRQLITELFKCLYNNKI
jgi:hypothetical protein